MVSVAILYTPAGIGLSGFKVETRYLSHEKPPTQSEPQRLSIK